MVPKLLLSAAQSERQKRCRDISDPTSEEARRLKFRTVIIPCRWIPSWNCSESWLSSDFQHAEHADREVITTKDYLRASYIVRQTAEAVNFEAAVRALKSLRVLSTKATCIELGPSPICAGLIRNYLNSGAPHVLSSTHREYSVGGTVQVVGDRLHGKKSN